jgi:hypothetical protein
MTVRSSRDKLGQGPPATVSLRSRTVVLSEMAAQHRPVMALTDDYAMSALTEAI